MTPIPAPAKMSTADAVIVGRHLKAALLHLQAAEAAAATAGVELDDRSQRALAFRRGDEALATLDGWGVWNAQANGAGTVPYQGTERWCHTAGGVLPHETGAEA